MEQCSMEYITCTRNKLELEKVVIGYKNSKKPVLICVSNKKVQLILI